MVCKMVLVLVVLIATESTPGPYTPAMHDMPPTSAPPNTCTPTIHLRPAFVQRAADAAVLAVAASSDTTRKLAKPAYDLLNACLSGA